MTQVLPNRPPKARPYLGLILLLPAAAACWFGWTRYNNVPVSGTVEAVKVSTKAGMVGQAAEAVDNLKIETPDLYIQIYPKTGDKLVMPAFKDTPIGNGLTWNLPRTFQLTELDRIEIWDHNSMLKDKQIDRITIESNWEPEGQRFHLTLLGKHPQPPDWAMPTMIAGGAVGVLVLLKFVWDQVV